MQDNFHMFMIELVILMSSANCSMHNASKYLYMATPEAQDPIRPISLGLSKFSPSLTILLHHPLLSARRFPCSSHTNGLLKALCWKE